MAQLISIGDVIVNLDNVSILDVDSGKVRAFGSNGEIVRIDLDVTASTLIDALVAKNMQFRGSGKTEAPKTT